MRCKALTIVFGIPGLTLVHKKDPGKYQDDRKDFKNIEAIHSPKDCGKSRNHGLHVIVHGNEGWPQGLLTDWDKEIAEKRTSEHDECEGKILVKRD